MKPKDIIMVTFSGGTKSLVRVCGDFDIDNPTKINVVFILDVITSDGTYSCNNTINSDFIEHITRDNYDKIIAEIFTSTNIDKLKELAQNFSPVPGPDTFLGINLNTIVNENIEFYKQKN